MSHWIIVHKDYIDTILERSASKADLLENLKEIGELNPQNHPFIVIPDACNSHQPAFVTNISLDWESSNTIQILLHKEKKLSLKKKQKILEKVFCEMQPKLADITRNAVTIQTKRHLINRHKRQNHIIPGASGANPSQNEADIANNLIEDSLTPATVHGINPYQLILEGQIHKLIPNSESCKKYEQLPEIQKRIIRKQIIKIMDWQEIYS
jgi:hypothetical protein